MSLTARIWRVTIHARRPTTQKKRRRICLAFVVVLLPLAAMTAPAMMADAETQKILRSCV
jgi:hypothetical protein